MTQRADIVSVARGYKGTPFHHRGRLPGGALDCVGVLICAAREVGIFSTGFDVPAYGPNPDGTMITLCDRYMGRRVTQSTMQIGDAIALKSDLEKYARHLGIIADYTYGGFSIIHASNDRLHMRVIEHRILFSRHFRFAGAWSFPGIA